MMVEVLVTVAPEDAPDPADPFRYGWRWIERQGEDGVSQWAQMPLTLEDVPHPEEGDQVTHSEAHQRRSTYLYDVFQARLAADPTAVVLQDVRIAWDVPELRAHAPGLAVILGVREHLDWSTFDVAAEGVRPALIVELTSPATASLARSVKLEHYDRAGVPLYVIVDAVVPRQQPALRLFGYERTSSGYQSLATNERGWLWLPPVRVWLGVVEGELVCYDERGQPLGDYRAVAAALAEAERRASAAEARLQELEGELRRPRGE